MKDAFGKITNNSNDDRLLPTAVLVAVALLVPWMGLFGAGYFPGQWTVAAGITALLVLLASLAGLCPPLRRDWSGIALALFTAFAAWTALSMLWSPNAGDAWVGTGQTLLYLMAFWIVLAMLGAGASRRRVLAATALGPAAVAAFTLLMLPAHTEDLFEYGRLLGTAGYANGQAAFLLVPFWAAIYLAASRRVHPLLRGLLLAGAALSLNLAVLTQSRGAMVSLGVSLLVYFALSGQRLRGFVALLPAALALAAAFPDLNEVYQAFLREEAAGAALSAALPKIWLGAAAAGLYGLLWGAADSNWRLSTVATRVLGSLVLAGVIVATVVAGAAALERVGDPVGWAESRWEAFKSNDPAGHEQSRYLSISGSGRYTLWQVAWRDFAENPITGVGTHNYEATFYQLRERGGFWVRQPHMLPLEVLAERGAVGGALFLGFLAVCAAGGLWARFRELNPQGKAQVGALLACVAYWFVHSGAEWFWQMPAITLPAIFYLALLAGPWGRSNASASGWTARAAGLVASILTLAAVIPLYAADHYVQRSYAAESPQEALELVERAQRFDPLNPRLAQREAELAMSAGDWERVELSYRRAIELNPEHYAPYMFLADFYERRGELEKALEMYQEALRRNPLDSDLNRRAVHLAYQTGVESVEVGLRHRGEERAGLTAEVARSAADHPVALRPGTLLILPANTVGELRLRGAGAPVDVALADSAGSILRVERGVSGSVSEDQPYRLVLAAESGFFDRAGIGAEDRIVLARS
ncbi:O-antigen ligase family protein [Rubrobacter taiwanensis]|uniref:O-antigen ligase family protein n=1 Tax=Rubrobacter taiwanensis TaxID=185139 RepID=UPI001FB1F210|nr:O-antigen ligase family protein [Rubrobacter taiwanensis]